jgi:hypothetical protein
MSTKLEKVAARAAYYAWMAYLPYDEMEYSLEYMDWKWFDLDDTQVLLVRDDEFGAFVAFRGTQVSERFSWADIWSNVRLSKIGWVMGGRVHSGYDEAIMDVSASLWAELQYIEGPLWYTGHSLGGVLATLMTSLPVTGARPNPNATFTFGAPRVGDKEFNETIVSPLYRYVYGADIAPTFPPWWLGFRHCRPVTWLNRKRFRLPSFVDHSVENYLAEAIEIAERE